MAFPVHADTYQSGKTLSRLKLFFLFYTLSVVLLLLVGYLSYHVQWKQRLTLVSEGLNTLISLEYERILQEFEQICLDLVYLSRITKDSLNNQDSPDIKAVQGIIKTLGDTTGRYSQIRILDEGGHETFRLDNHTGEMLVTGEIFLQDKSHRFYFREMSGLGPNTLYFSDLDLNIEYGKVVIPYDPVIRAGVRLDVPGNSAYAFLILNHRSEVILQSLGEGDNILETPFVVSFLNSQGYWLRGPDPEKEWGFMFENKKGLTLAEENPAVWEKIETSGAGQFWQDDNLYTYQSISFENLLTIVSSDALKNRNIGFYNNNKPYYLLYQVSGPDLWQIKKNILGNLLLPFLLIQLALAGLCVILSRLVVSSRVNHDRLIRYANVDELTGCLNRRAGLQVLEQFLSLERRRGEIMTLAYMDINSLKFVNDTYGHEEGDRYILAIVNLVRDHLRSGDSLVRMGGDEFLIILPDCVLSQAEQIHQRVLEQEKRINDAGQFSYRVSFSWGALEILPDQIYNVESIIARADSLMYLEKKKYHKTFPGEGRT